MKKFFLIISFITFVIMLSTFALLSVNSVETFAQGPNTNNHSPAQVQQQATQGSFFGPANNNDNPCTDCDEVKQVIKASHASSGTHYKISFSMKKWSNKFSGRMDMKIKKFFAHRKKIRTNYETCFNWH